ncbi:MAG TPA: hypothetical protein VJ697_05935 [Nitrososphaeraceae archaeon]|nr:hypothetical protein [Nitrososphaeraceae archaeon]
MISVAFCSVCGKNEFKMSEFTNKNGNVICKKCWIKENNSN